MMDSQMTMDTMDHGHPIKSLRFFFRIYLDAEDVASLPWMETAKWAPPGMFVGF